MLYQSSEHQRGELSTATASGTVQSRRPRAVASSRKRAGDFSTRTRPEFDKAVAARKYQQTILKHQMAEKELAKVLEAKEERRYADRVKADQEMCDGWERRTQLMKRVANKHYVHALKSQINARDRHRKNVSQ